MDGELIECEEYKLQIFNRWGEKVFETDDPEDCWNGGVHNNSNLLPSGTYFYLVWHGENNDPISGIVELIK
jgi:gliding motility-associated-like protein